MTEKIVLSVLLCIALLMSYSSEAQSPSKEEINVLVLDGKYNTLLSKYSKEVVIKSLIKYDNSELVIPQSTWMLEYDCVEKGIGNSRGAYTCKRYLSNKLKAFYLAYLIYKNEKYDSSLNYGIYKENESKYVYDILVTGRTLIVNEPNKKDFVIIHKAYKRWCKKIGSNNEFDNPFKGTGYKWVMKKPKYNIEIN